MKKYAAKFNKKLKPGPLTRIRAEKISAVEGLSLTPRMKSLLDMAAGKSSEERRELVRAQFAKKSA